MEHGNHDLFTQHSIYGSEMTRWINALLKVTITCVLLYFVANKVDLTKAVDLLVRSNLGVIATAILVLHIQAVFAMLRWHQIMIEKRLLIPMPLTARYFWIGVFFNQVLPSSIGGDAVRGYYLVRGGHPLGSATVCILLDRILGMAGLVLLIMLVIPLAAKMITIPEMRWGAVFALVVSTSGLVSMIFLDNITKKFADWRVMRGLTTLARDLRQLLASKQGLSLISLSVIVHFLSIVVVGMLAWSLAIKVEWSALAIIVPIATLVTTVPVSIAGWGVREGVMVVGLGYIGVVAEEALALSILYGISLLIVGLPGGFFWLSDPTFLSRKSNQTQSKEIV